MRGSDWTVEEVEAAVADYFAMLHEELAGVAYNKSAHRRHLLTRLNDRSPGAIELKHQNISAILNEAGYPSIEGYKPRGNYQGLLQEVVLARIATDTALSATVATHVEAPEPSVPSVQDILSILEDPPPPLRETVGPQVRERSGGSRPANYLQREANNRSLGRAGEALVLNFERARLIRANQPSLADRIEHTAVEDGDEAGYDVRSFETDGSDRFIEVKTTRFGRDTPFFVSRNQVSVSASLEDRYHLYRLFRFNKGPRMFALRGPVERSCRLEPVTFVGRAG